MNHLMTSSIGRHSVDFLKANNIRPQLIYIPQRHTNRGDQQGNIIRIYMSNILSEKVAAQTIVHEVAHCELGIGNCQLAEAICMAKEKMHITNKDYLTRQEWEYVAKLARDNYPEYGWKHGGIGNYDEYINVID